ncbi:MAG: alpha/beta hydrolase [Clostridia bacterium]|nr:alpha/beta hydrolase [Clostridia bacterium]
MAKNHISSKIFSSWWLRRLLLGILIFALVMLFALYMIPSSALKPFIHTHIDSEVAFTPDEFFLTPVDFTVTTKDGLTLKGEEYRVEKAKGVVILTAGLYNPVSSSLYGHAKFFNDNDYSVIIYDSRAHNESEGNSVGHGITETADLDAVIEYVRSFTTYLNLPIYLMGWNTGGAASINAAAENPYVSGVIAVGSYANTRDYFYSLMRDEAHMSDLFLKIGEKFMDPYLAVTFGFGNRKVSPDLSLESLRIPVLLIAATGDEFIPSEESEALAKGSGKNVTLWLRDVGYHYVTGYFINLEKDPEYCSKHLDYFAAAEEAAANADPSGD